MHVRLSAVLSSFHRNDELEVEKVYKIYTGYTYIDNSRGLFAANDTFEFSNSFNKGSLLRNTTE